MTAGSDAKGASAYVTLTLSPYQAANLHNALRLIFREAPCDLPIRSLNNGDWCGELFWMLDGKVTVPPNAVWGELSCPCCGREALERPGNAMCMGCAQYGCADIDAEPCQLTKKAPARTPSPGGQP